MVTIDIVSILCDQPSWTVSPSVPYMHLKWRRPQDPKLCRETHWFSNPVVCAMLEACMGLKVSQPRSAGHTSQMVILDKVSV